MKQTLLMLFAAGALPLAACNTTSGDSTLASAGTGAAVGAAGGAGVAALAGGDLLTGAVIGAAVGGVAGAVWADSNNDGRVDGYTSNGQYYSGAPAGYQPSAYGAGTPGNPAYAAPYGSGTASAPTCRNVGTTALTGAGLGAAAGAGVGAVASGVGVLEGALVGAAVGGLAGAVWADSNNDGCVDGYMREGRYYQGAPYQSGPTVQPVSTRAGERG